MRKKLMERIPRKLKKGLKKDLQAWEKFVTERKTTFIREEHLDVIFTRDYSNGRRALRKMFKKGR